MPITVHADVPSYTMDSTADNLYLYNKEWLANNGLPTTSANGFGNEKDNKIFGTSTNGNPGSGANMIHGFGGNDTIFGYSGNDMIFGDDGNDVLNGGAGGDTLSGGAGDDVIRAGNGDNTELVFAPYSNAAVSQESFDQIDGGDGNDRIYADGLDVIYGGNGNDRIFLGQFGRVTAFGGDGDDIFYSNSNSRVVISGGDGNDRIVARADFDMANADADVERLVVQNTAGVTIKGNMYDNIIVGDDGNDTLSTGTGGDDRLNGGAGNDTLIVGSDIFGYAGGAVLTGGAGEDVFYFDNLMIGKHTHGANNAIVIRDFEQGIDKIRLAQYQSKNVNDGHITFGEIPNNGESFAQLYKKAQEMHNGYTNSLTIAYFDHNGSTYVVESSGLFQNGYELAFRLTGVYDLTESDFRIDVLPK